MPPHKECPTSNGQVCFFHRVKESQTNRQTGRQNVDAPKFHPVGHKNTGMRNIDFYYLTQQFVNLMTYYKLIVLVMETASPLGPRTERCDVPVFEKS